MALLKEKLLVYKAAARSHLSNTPTNLCIALYCILLYCVVLNCIVLLIYCYVDIIQYNGVHKFVGVLDNPLQDGQLSHPRWIVNQWFLARYLCSLFFPSDRVFSLV